MRESVQNMLWEAVL